MRMMVRRLSRVAVLAVIVALFSAPVGMVQAVLVWQTETVEHLEDGGLVSSLALDGGGQPHISYLDQASDHLKYASFDGNAWQIETVDSAEAVGTTSSLALDGGGQPHISYHVDSIGVLKYASFDGSAWQIETVDAEGIVGVFNSLALDSADRPHISYYDFANQNLKYATFNGATWQIETVDEEGVVGRLTSLALDSAGRPHISYYDQTNRNLKYAAFDGNAWQIETVDATGNVAGVSSLVLDSEDVPRISYFDMININLKYAAFNGVTWQIETVDTEGGVGEESSLALDGADQPHIIYPAVYDDDLRYAFFDGTTWHIETVDTGVDRGRRPSLALNSAGLPHISYHDVNSFDLKYAYLALNAAPAVDAGGPYSGTEGSPINLQGTASDPEGDDLITAWSYQIDSAGPGTSCEFGDASQVETTFTCTDDGSFTLTLTADDGLNPPVSDTATVTFTGVTHLCANNYTGVMRYDEDCRDYETAVTIPDEEGPVQVCADRSTGLLRLAGPYGCPAQFMSYMLPEDGPLSVCVNTYTDVVRLVDEHEACQPHEYGEVIAAREMSARSPHWRSTATIGHTSATSISPTAISDSYSSRSTRSASAPITSSNG